MPSPWSVVESHRAEHPALLPLKDAKVKFSEFVNQNIPEANAKYYYANKYLFGNGDLQTILTSSAYDEEYPVWYGRRYFLWQDGSQVSVDYAIQIGDNAKPQNWNEDVKYVPQPDTPRLPDRTRIFRPEEIGPLDNPETTAPLFITIHGLTGGSHENYVRSAICDLRKTCPEAESIVITFRGCNRSKITTPQLFNGCWTEDIRNLVKHITLHQPKRPIFIAGYSLGASILANYLGQEGENTAPQIKSGIVVSCPWDLLLCWYVLHSSWMGNHVYVRKMGANLCRLAENNAEVMQQSPLWIEQFKKMSSISTVRDFDETFTAPLHGFDSALDYYRSASAVNRLRSIRVPTLVLSAQDDPICPDVSTPYVEASKNPYVHLVTTTHGGHLGWFAQRQSRWYSTVIAKYISAFTKEVNLSAKPEVPAAWKPAKRWFVNDRFDLARR